MSTITRLERERGEPTTEEKLDPYRTFKTAVNRQWTQLYEGSPAAKRIMALAVDLCAARGLPPTTIVEVDLPPRTMFDTGHQQVSEPNFINMRPMWTLFILEAETAIEWLLRNEAADKAAQEEK